MLEQLLAAQDVAVEDESAGGLAARASSSASTSTAASTMVRLWFRPLKRISTSAARLSAPAGASVELALNVVSHSGWTRGATGK